MKEIMTPREAAEYLSVHVRTIYRLAKKGEIPVKEYGDNGEYGVGNMRIWGRIWGREKINMGSGLSIWGQACDIWESSLRCNHGT